VIGITGRRADTPADWKVLLIGGSSGVGKTLVARELAQNLSVSNLLVDDIRLAVQHTTTAANEPDIHVFLKYRSENWKQPEKICSDWITVGNFMAKPLGAIIAHHINDPSVGRIIIEGD
jgi:2-phosphoglycerate kinase